ncbi:hypothetical protein SKAU_G00227180 [Synaphobranchus kaupii]|uniref:Uncharacterized protein n=1 Tax=Synaphobranchus kaupii TaxID=118154 RepID=A0A9Q1F4V6_SYNKA|nr:hypothetical protein SKAU_G00227180 [Synaphobranchus kaupii]
MQTLKLAAHSRACVRFVLLRLDCPNGDRPEIPEGSLRKYCGGQIGHDLTVGRSPGGIRGPLRFERGWPQGLLGLLLWTRCVTHSVYKSSN